MLAIVEAQVTMHKDLQKKDGKALFLHQFFNGNIFEKIMHCENAKDKLGIQWKWCMLEMTN